MATLRDVLAQALGELVSPVASRTILSALPAEVASEVGSLDLVSAQALVRQVEMGLNLFHAPTPAGLVRTLRWRCMGGNTPPSVTMLMAVRSRDDVLLVQRNCHDLCKHFLPDADHVALGEAAVDLANSLRAEGRTGDLQMELSEDPQGLAFTLTATASSPQLLGADSTLVARRTPGGTETSLLRVRTHLDGLDVGTSANGATMIRGWKRFKTGP